MAVENMKFMQECYSQKLAKMWNLRTSVVPNPSESKQQERKKKSQETGKRNKGTEGENERMNMEYSAAGTKERSPGGLNYSFGLPNSGVATPRSSG